MHKPGCLPPSRVPAPHALGAGPVGSHWLLGGCRSLRESHYAWGGLFLESKSMLFFLTVSPCVVKTGLLVCLSGVTGMLHHSQRLSGSYLAASV